MHKAYFMHRQAYQRRREEKEEITNEENESDLEVEANRIQLEIDNLNNEKIAQDAEINRLQKELAALTSRSVDGEQAIFCSKFADDFTVHGILGGGEFGCVFEAENRYDDCRYAVKRVAVDASKKTMVKALGEVRAMAQLDHPGIVRYNSTWVEEPPDGWQYETDVEMLKNIKSPAKRTKVKYRDDCVFIYIQMQLCNYSLSKWLDENTAPTLRHLPRMKAWFKQIASAVAYIHEKNLIHRDLKPSNILFVDEDRLKVGDLGISTERSVEEGMETAMTRTNIGTALYMSPEQRFTTKYSSKTDVFALGLLLAELCIVMTPPDRSVIFDNYRRGIQSDLITESKTADFIEKLTKVDPKNRLSTREMLDHLYLS